MPRTRAQLAKQGFAKPWIDAFIRGLDADIADRLRQASPPRQPRATDVPRPVALLEIELARRGVAIRSVTEGRPIKIEIEADEQPVVIGEEHADWFCRLEPGKPVTAALSYATRRSHGNAPFNISGFLDDDLPAAKRLAQPALYFFVLLEESRVWVLARGALRDLYAEVRQGEKVHRFSSPKEGYLRLLLPRTKVGFDLDQCVIVEDGA